MRICGFFSRYILQRLITHISFPTFLVDCIVKIHKDVRNLPALSDLLTFLTSGTFGGKLVGDSVIFKSAKLIDSILLFGFSLKMI
mmetsp:Transcript_34571/g.33785  ORF Transcript_34571/g.33785 Transcript_34571/m.33785 type:complete len:85 (+) Transcript_34571:1442-1696(+)